MLRVAAPWERADDRKVKLFRGRASSGASTMPATGFGEWVVRRITPEAATSTLTFAQLEQVLSNAASLICGAVYGNSAAFLGRVPLDVPAQHEAMIVAKRTADGFQASLKDRNNVVLAWPWDHLGTRVAWLATRSGDTDEPAVGDALFAAAVTYTLMHREQLTAVVGLWQTVVAGLRPPGGANIAPIAASLPEMGAQLLEVYQALGG